MNLLVHSHGRLYDLSWKEFLRDPDRADKGTYKVMYDHGERVTWTNDAHEYIAYFDKILKSGNS